MAVGGNRVHNFPIRGNSRACLAVWISLLFLSLPAYVFLISIVDGVSRLQSDIDYHKQLLQLLVDIHSEYPVENSNDTLHQKIQSPKDDKYSLANHKISVNDSGHSPNSRNFMFTSCKEIIQEYPLSPSGYYLIKLNTEYYTYVYCDMTLKCGGITGGWSRLAYLNIHEPGTHCPDGLRPVQDPLSCKRQEIEAGCTSIKYALQPKPYTHICGKVNGIHYRSLDGFARFTSTRPRDPTIDDNYVDGVILTYGNVNSRTHIWTFAAASCSISHSEQKVPKFVGNHYSFDGGDPGTGPIYDGTLWDNHQCSFSPADNGPWFYRKFSQVIYEGIEMRVCRDESGKSEELFIQNFEIFVQ